MSKSIKPTCHECYFRRAGLCALGGDDICPTFRAAKRGSLVPPRQPALVPRTVAASTAAA